MTVQIQNQFYVHISKQEFVKMERNANIHMIWILEIKAQKLTYIKIKEKVKLWKTGMRKL